MSDYYDVIDHYSVKGYEWPNSNFLQFIEDNAYFIPTDYPLVLEICGTHFSERQQQTIESTIRDFFKNLIIIKIIIFHTKNYITMNKVYYFK